MADPLSYQMECSARVSIPGILVNTRLDKDRPDLGDITIACMLVKYRRLPSFFQILRRHLHVHSAVALKKNVIRSHCRLLPAIWASQKYPGA